MRDFLLIFTVITIFCISLHIQAIRGDVNKIRHSIESMNVMKIIPTIEQFDLMELNQ